MSVTTLMARDANTKGSVQKYIILITPAFSSINGLLEKIENQKSTFERNKQELDDKILEFKDEIASLNHFQEVREEMEEHEVNLTKEVAAQKGAFQA